MRLQIRLHRRLLAVTVLVTTMLSITAVSSGQGALAANPTSPSYLVLDKSGTATKTFHSSCSASAGCPNGILFTWTKATCFNVDRYPPIAIVWTVKGKVAHNFWPIIAPCSVGLQLTWSANNVLTKAAWKGASDSTVDLRRFPTNASGTDMFFQGSDSLAGAEWLRNGKPAGAISLPKGSNDVYWYGYTSPKSPFRSVVPAKRISPRRDTVARPKVVLLGRDSAGNDATTSSSAPSTANDIDFAWYLPNNQSGNNRGCLTQGSTAWTSPPVALEYLTAGALNSRVTVLRCPKDASGNLMHFNNLDFSWKLSSSGTKYLLATATPNFNGKVLQGLPEGMVPQPPTGTDGLYFGFHHDNYQSSTWTKNGAALGSPIHPPAHTRLAEWNG